MATITGDPSIRKSSPDGAIVIIGWREWVALPDLGLKVKAKVDTGARTSALHAFELEAFFRNGVEWIRFKIHPQQYRADTEVVCEAVVKAMRVVTDSGGHRELRPVIESKLELGGRAWPIEITLTAREDRRFRMLLGRTAISGRVLVDPGRSYLMGATRRRKRPRSAP